VGIKDRDYMRDGRPSYDDDDGGASSTPLWAKAVIVLLILSLVATAVVNNF